MFRTKATLLYLLLSASFPLLAEAAQRFDIPSQDLASSLNQLAVAADWQIVFAPELVRNLRGKAVAGIYTSHEAIQLLLDGTGLQHEFIGVHTVAIRSAIQSNVNGQRRGEGNEGSTTAAMQLAQSRSTSSDSNAHQTAENSTVQARESDENAQKKPDEVETIVVTAQKREESLQDVPISITVLGGNSLDRSTDTGLTEALNRVPGVAATPGPGTTRLTVRGVSATSGGLAGSTPIAYYLDSVSFGFVRNAFVPDINVYDLDRIEVLRGPQGTLYGASAQNGVVRVLTRDANLKNFEFKARASTSHTDEGDLDYRGDMAINLPLLKDKLAARAVVGFQELSGWIDRPNKKGINDAQVGNFRLKINAQPTDQLSIGLLSWFLRRDHDADQISNDNGERPLSLVDEPGASDFDLYSLRVGYEFPWASVTSATSYLDYTSATALDLRPFGLPFEARSLQPSEVFSQEIYLNSARQNPWRWSLGGVYRDSEETLFQDIAGLLPVPLHHDTTSESFAVFGELTRSFLDARIELTVGLRYFEDQILGRDISSRISGVPLAPHDSDDKFDSLTPRIILTWHPSDDMTAYVSYAEGFRSGLNQLPQVLNLAPGFPAADPDLLKNYEVGMKGSMGEGRLTYDAAIYYMDWQDVQQLVTLALGTGGLSVATPVNGESASGMGFEFAATVELTDGLTLGANVSWNDLAMDGDVFSQGIPLFSKGDRLNNSPKTTAGASADYVFPIGGSGLEGRLAASVNHISERSDRIILAGTSLATKGDSFSIARASFSIEWPENWTATLFADNFNNESGAVSRGVFSTEWDPRVRPRTVGLQFDYRFD